MPLDQVAPLLKSVSMEQAPVLAYRVSRRTEPFMLQVL